MTIKEKAKAYDEAIIRANKMIKDMTNIGGVAKVDDIQYIFPELKESEDDKIRKAIYNCVKWFGFDSCFFKDVSQEECLAWLEKQGEQKSVNKETDYGNISDVLLNKECWRNYEDKQKPAEEYNITGIGSKNAEGKLGEMLKNLKPINEVLEQNNTNKVEPKFKVENGKWYICTQTFVLRGKIVVIKGQVYQAQENGAIKGEEGCLFVDKHDGKASEYFRLWTIKDAKDGDVLATDDGNIFVFDGTVEDGKYPFAHYGLTRRRFESYDRRLPFTHNNIRPATKKQRDLLFQKMKEAGYEWDAEKKELKKIEQKPVVSLDENGEPILTDFESALFTTISYFLQSYNSGEEINVAEFAKEYAPELLEAANKQQKPVAWSEEDEERYESCLKRLGTGNPKQPETINSKWFREHVSPQPHWKPSEEQMKALKEACDEHWEPDGLNPLYTLYEQLKTL